MGLFGSKFVSCRLDKIVLVLLAGVVLTPV